LHHTAERWFTGVCLRKLGVQYFAPGDVNLSISLGYIDINGLRKVRYENAKARGYACVSYVSSRALVWPNLLIGENTMIAENSVIQPFARIGNNCIVRSSVHISHHAQVADHSFIAAGVTTGGNVKIGERCFVGLGAIVRDNLSLAPKTFVGAGALVIQNTEENGLYIGAPARLQKKRADEV
jgi:sugar O-acyltransferase (sialic acid O-acetyltransferase NeuD family)